MSEISLFLKALAVFAVFGAISAAGAFYYAFRVYSSFDDDSDAMQYYRESSTHSFPHRMLRLVTAAAAVIFLIITVLRSGSVSLVSAEKMYCAAAVFIVLAFDVNFIPLTGELMARAKLFYFIRSKYSLGNSDIIDWYVNLDEDDYPEELEFTILSDGKDRIFNIDLVHFVIREIDART